MADKHRLFFLLTCLAVVAIGCGDGRPRRVPVSGQVTIDGEPVRAGFIRVIPRNARAATGRLDADGRFVLTTFDEGDGCVLGIHPVAIIAFEERGGTLRWLVPEKYRFAEQSGLTAEITGPTDSLTFHLTWEGEKPLPAQPYDASGDVDPTKMD